MKNINNILDWSKRNSRIIIIWFLLLALFIVFELKVSKLIIKFNFLGEEEVGSRYFARVYTVVKTIGLIIFFFLFIKNYRLSKYLNFWFLFLAVTYFILKTNQTDELDFIPVSLGFKDNSVFFADIFLDLGYLTTILFFRNLFKDFKLYDTISTALNKFIFLKNEDLNSTYKEDIPINGSEIIDSDRIVTTLKSQIAGFYPKNAFVIGVNGEWGSGKTTFLKRLEYKLRFELDDDKKAPIVFWFNAWQHQGEKSIINNFFSQLKKELASYSGDAKASINNYLSKLLSLFDSKYSKGVNFLSMDLLKNQSTIKDYYDNLDNLISSIDRRIVIFVDDLDRLNKNEIIEVVRILRNVANFRNTLFICGFDKKYVLKTGGFENKFLDKIFNIEINLPKFHQNGLLIFFESMVKSSKVLENEDVVIEEFKSLFESDTGNLLDEINIDNIIGGEKEEKPSDFSIVPLSPSLFFDTRRDVKRFYNSLITDLNVLDSINDVELEDYLLYKLLVFRYSWLLNQFDNKSIDIWLGADNVLKLDYSKLDLLWGKEELELVDKNIVYTVLLRLFPTTLVQNEEITRKINQRRYFPIYFNNNVFNQSFSYSSLIKAHSEKKIMGLISEIIEGNENENYLLNDVKSFILKEENLNTLEEIKQVIEIIRRYLKGKVSEYELVQLIHVGEKIEGFKEFANREIFIDLDDDFGQFLGLLNLYYTRKPNDVSMNRDDISTYLSRNKIKELSFINKEYVKGKIIELYEGFLVVDVDLKEASRKLFNCTEDYYPFFSLYLYYDGISNLFKNYLKNNFESIFLSESPREFLKFVTGDFIASIFANEKSREDIKKEADDLLTKKTQWQTSDLDKSKFNKEGWGEFLSFIQETSKGKGFDEEKESKAKKFYAYVYTFVRKGFIVPTKQEVLVDEILLRMWSKDEEE